MLKVKKESSKVLYLNQPLAIIEKKYLNYLKKMANRSPPRTETTPHKMFNQVKKLADKPPVIEASAFCKSLFNK